MTDEIGDPKPPRPAAERPYVDKLTDIIAIRAYLNRIGARDRGLRTAVVEEHRGTYWIDRAEISFGGDGAVTIRHTDNVDLYSPTPDEAEAIKEEVKTWTWPVMSKVTNLIGGEPWTKHNHSGVYEFRDRTGMITMVQVRGERKRSDGEVEKAYLPWTYWSDGKWRCAQPDEKLPLYNLDKLGDHSTVFLHEGAKAAAAMHRLVTSDDRISKAALAEHPWRDDIVAGVHLGWIGGALNPQKTDWSQLKSAQITTVYIIADNDDPGKEATARISRQLDLDCFCIEFNSRWPASWDMADEWPADMWTNKNEEKHYVGPQFHDMVQPATFATQNRVVIGENGKPKVIKELRDVFHRQWQWVERPGCWVNKRTLEMYTKEDFNENMLQWSGVKNLSDMMRMRYRETVKVLTYSPGLGPTCLGDGNMPALNLYKPPKIRPAAGDVGPWLEFLGYLIPDKDECYQVQRWVATLIGKPRIKLGYGLLMISETQGTGKSWLGDKVLKAILGSQSVSNPSSATLAEGRNTWINFKRLAVVHELYEGANDKAYNRTKSAITEDTIEVNEKYMAHYTVENRINIYACSNDIKAIKIKTKDRRWYIPTITEEKWDRSEFGEFKQWLDTGGLNKIYNWALKWEDYVAVGESAPNTELKRDLEEDGLSSNLFKVQKLAEQLASQQGPAAIAMKDIIDWLKSSGERITESNMQIRRHMVKVAGCHVIKRRVVLGSTQDYVVGNQALEVAIARIEKAKDSAEDVFKSPAPKTPSEATKLVRESLKKCKDLSEPEM